MSRRIAIVGATGAVGKEMLTLLEDPKYDITDITLFASAKSAGKSASFRDQKIVIQQLTESSFVGLDLALFAVESELSKKFAPMAAKAGCVVIDNSSAFRMDDDVPLIVPEINPGAIKQHQRIIANPNCTTIITLLAVFPLHSKFGVKRITASSYQAVSGSGEPGIRELTRQTREVANGQQPTAVVYHDQIVHNLIPLIGVVQANGYTDEELKLRNEGRKIMGLQNFGANATCIRVPVERAHTVSVTAELVESPTPEQVRAVLRLAPGIDVVDDPENLVYPTPLEQAGLKNCAVGRIRTDPDITNRISFVVCGDQVLKGAALNAVQIAELLWHN